MKLFEISDSSIIRNSIGKTITSKQMIIVLSRIFGHEYTTEDVVRFVRPFNVAMNDLDPYDEDAVNSAKIMWSRLDAELSHQNKRSQPDS